MLLIEKSLEEFISLLLPEPITCKRCGVGDDYTTRLNGPHTEAICNNCGRHIKFLPKNFNPAGSGHPVNSMLKIAVIGHLGKDAVVNSVNGKNVINFSVAHSEKYKDQAGTQVEKTTWIECAKWGESTAVAPYLKKGTQVYVEGTPEVSTYQKNDGSTGTTLRCRVGLVQLLGSATGNQNTGSNEAANAANEADGDGSPENPKKNLPF